MSVAVPPRAARILVIEDDAVHAELIREYLAKARLENPVEVARDGDEARTYLRARLASGGRSTLPPLILVDGHLGNGSGLDLVAWLKDDPALRSIPVVMLTSSTEPADIERAHELGAASYLIKPVGFDALIETVRRLGLPWLLVPESRAAPEIAA